MEFTLIDADGNSREYGSDDSYRFAADTGLLIIDTADGKRITFSPHAWLRIEETLRPDDRTVHVFRH